MEELWSFVMAILIGSLIGLQREYSQQKKHMKLFAGIRTFILITLFGAVLGYLSPSIDSALILVGFISIILLVSISYILTYLRTRNTSATTEVSAIFVYILGVMCTKNYEQLAVIFGILVAAFLAFKEYLHHLAKKMEKKELFAMIEFALVSLVVLPLLPNKNYSPLDIPGLGNFLSALGISPSVLSSLDVLNFYSIWLIVVLVSGIGFLGYFLVKFIGSKKGYGILGFVGGIVSSTAVTLSMAEESKKVKNYFSPYVLATVLSGSIMFIRVIFEISLVNVSLLSDLIFPLLLMSLAGIVVSSFFFRKISERKSAKEIEFEQPFALKPALKFGLFFGLILIISRIAGILFGSTGFYLTGILSGLAGIDAIVLSMSSLAKSGLVSNFVASTSIMLAVASNTLVKVGIAYYVGSRQFSRRILFASIIILVVGFLALFFI